MKPSMLERQIVELCVDSVRRDPETADLPIYHEVPHPTGRGRADLVLRAVDGCLCVIEAKPTLSLYQAIQGARWRLYAERVTLVCADAPAGWEDVLVPGLVHQGIGVVIANLRAGTLHRVMADEVRPPAHRAKLDALLTAERDGRYARGGSKGGRYVTDKRALLLRLSEYVQDNPGQSLDDAMVAIGLGEMSGDRLRTEVSLEHRQFFVEALQKRQVPGVMARKLGDTFLLYRGGRVDQ